MTSDQFTIRLSVDEDAVREQAMSPRSLVCGVWIEINSTPFPCSGWIDFAVVVLGWWLDLSLRLQSGVVSDAVFRFMEGPYELAIVAFDDGDWKAKFVDRSMQEEHGGQFSLTSEATIGELKRASAAVLALCKSCGKWDKDCETLESLLAQP